MSSTDGNNTDILLSTDSNCVIISGNIPGRAMSDSGNFTKCICDSFKKTLDSMIKADFNTIMTEIGRNLEQMTNHAELCNVNGTLRYNLIRFEKGNDAITEQ
eukprot:496636_1